MLCCVNDCGREAHYKAAALCQKHYFRMWRYGTTELTRQARPRFEDERGYQFLYAPGHPLIAKGQFYMAEHRVVLYADIGAGPMNCAVCNTSLTWKTCDVDHIDENPRNNERANLRPTCLRCNVWRSMPPAHICRKNALGITFEGETKTPNEWSKDPRISLSGGQIRLRKKAGLTDEQALFAPKRTHNGNAPAKASYRAKLKELKRSRG